MSQSTLLQAQWVLPMDGRVLSPGLIRCAEGRIVSVEQGGDPEARQLGKAAILPGLINAHTHLEFSDLDRPLPASATFADWVRRVVACRRGRTTPVAAAIRRGLRESQAAGTAIVGEIATDDVSAEALQRDGGCGVVFREVLGLQDDAVETGLATAERFLESFPWTDDDRLRPGLSPHAPYSVDPALFEALISRAVAERVPVAMHLAETREELQLLEDGSGPLVELLRGLGLWRPSRFAGVEGIASYLRRLAAAPRSLVIHGNYLQEAEIEFLAGRPNMSVVYCPRTHHHFGHAAHPWRDILARGVRVVFGTDSRASNPDLSLYRELQWLHARCRDVPAEQLLQMATREAAIALGIDRWAGTLEPGKSALVTVIAPAPGAGEFQWSDLLSASARVIDVSLP